MFTLGMGLFSLQNEDTTVAQWAVYQCVGALGAGMVLNTLLPAFQAPAIEADQAAATATWCFIRTFGYVWGVAIPAAIFNNRVDALIHQISDPTVRQLLAGGKAYQSASARFVEQFPRDIQSEVSAVYREALKRVWEIAIVFAGFACLLVFLEKEIPLRTALDTEYGLEGSKQRAVRSRDIENNTMEDGDSMTPQS